MFVRRAGATAPSKVGKVAEEKQPSPSKRRKVSGGEVRETAPECCLLSWLPQVHRAPRWLTGLCQAHLLQDTARRFILLRHTGVT